MFKYLSGLVADLKSACNAFTEELGSKVSNDVEKFKSAEGVKPKVDAVVNSFIVMNLCAFSLVGISWYLCMNVISLNPFIWFIVIMLAGWFFYNA